MGVPASGIRPRGGVDQECRITVRTTQGSPVVITQRNSRLHAALGRAANRTQERVSRRARFLLRSVARKTQEPQSKLREMTR